MMREQNKPEICLTGEEAYGRVSVVRFPGSQGFQVALRFPWKCEKDLDMKEIDKYLDLIRHHPFQNIEKHVVRNLMIRLED